MRVLLVHNFYQVPGGEDTVVQEELSMLRNNGLVTELFSVSNDRIKGIGGRLYAAMQTVYSLEARRALARRLTSFPADVVHVHNFFPLLSPSIFDACRQAGVPVVMTLHNFRILCPGALLYPDEALRERSLKHSCLWTIPKKVYRDSAAATLAVAAMVEFHKRIGTWTRKVDRFIALTESAKQTFCAGGLPSERIVVKPNCIAKPAEFKDVPREGALFVGRLDRQKGIATMLRAWDELDCPLKIIGDGPLSEIVERQASDRVIYLGRQPREVVQREMQSARFLVLPSVGCEMFPMTVLEAFSNRLPVICSDLPSLRELVQSNATGLMFPPGDASALAARVRWALSNPLALAGLAQQGYSAYERRYSREACFEQLLNIYLALCRDRPARHAGGHGRGTSQVATDGLFS